METWKDAVNFEGLYEVSDLGRVRNSRTGRILSPYTRRDGYVQVVLCKSKKQYTVNVHKLVGQAFVDGYREGLVINHINENPQDNRAENLEWVTQSENINYGNRKNKMIETRKENKDKLIYSPELDMTFSSVSEVADYLGCSNGHVNNVLLGYKKKCRGYSLFYVEK
jgi:hypothetical protein